MNADLQNKKHKIGWMVSKDVNRASSRIRGLNLINYFQKVAKNKNIEKYNEKNLDQYGLVIFCKLFEEKHIKKAQDLKQRGIKVCFDICDNYFDPEFKDKESMNRAIKICQIADYIVSSTQTLAKHILKAVPEKKDVIFVVEDHLETELLKDNFLVQILSKIKEFKFKKTLKDLGDKNLKFVWFGSAKSGIEHLRKLQNLFEKYAGLYPLSLTIISDDQQLCESVVGEWKIKVLYFKWDKNNFISLLKAHDTAIIPIEINNFSECKTNNRLILAMHAGLDVIADSIPSYKEFFDYCFLDNWEDGIKASISAKSDAGEKNQRIEGARKIIYSKYSIENIAKDWEGLLRKLKIL